MATLRIETDGPIGRLTLARPEKLNALNPAMLRELAEAAAALDANADIHVVIVAGEGRAFCAGFDLQSFTTDDGDGATLGAAMADAIEGMRAITIAAIHGHCVGGGVVLAAACDLRVAADDAIFSIPEVDLGIPLAWGGIPRLVRELGPAVTKDLVLTCRPFDATEAFALRFVQRCVPASQLVAAAEGLAHELARKAPIVLRQTKRHVAEVAEGLASTQHASADALALAEALADPEARAAARAYLERGRPQ